MDEIDVTVRAYQIEISIHAVQSCTNDLKLGRIYPSIATGILLVWQANTPFRN